MLLTEVLRAKGATVVTVTPEASVHELLAVLAEHGIGAAVVSRDGRSVDGIVSERDVVRALAQRGTAVLEEQVDAVCTHDVQTTGVEVRTEELMHLMTERRIRHVPVVVDGALAGIVSIGDVVKYRIGELETDHAALSAYISDRG